MAPEDADVIKMYIDNGLRGVGSHTHHDLEDGYYDMDLALGFG